MIDVTDVILHSALRLWATETIAMVQPGALYAPLVLMSLTAVVVDDSMLIRFTVGRFLEDRGFTVEPAVSGTEALDLVNRVKPDLIVTDLQMPRMSGSELITILKKDPETASLPIIVVTGQNEPQHDEKRANFTISKDIDIEIQLGKAIDALGLVGKQARAQAAGK
jgi:CheY-like chemotaxis protein